MAKAAEGTSVARIRGRASADTDGEKHRATVSQRQARGTVYFNPALDITAGREAWLVAYGALKLAVESVLELHGKLRLMPEIFDDLAEVHRAGGVSDGAPPAPPTLVAW